jgi:eukaryotic-like serine/threonine-protein kinase
MSVSDLPTAIDPMTAQGTIVGTLQYMAPEQLEGKEIDGRTDIFAFGAVLYEMATQKRAFEGKTQASVIGAILKDDPPPISSLQPMTPPALDRVVKRCLAKEPDERCQSAKDLTDELKWIAEGGSQVASAPMAAVMGTRALGPRALILSLGTLLLGAAIASIATWSLKPTPTQHVTRTVINLPPGQQLAGLDNGPAVALSPDGTHLAYVAQQGETQQLYLRAMDSLEARPVPGTEGAINPVFSPDGQWLAFFAGVKFKKISIGGGAAITLGDAQTARGASWGSQDVIAFAPTNISALQQLSDAGGAPQPLTRLEKGEVTQRWPEFLPGGTAVLYAAAPTTSNWNNAHVDIQLIGTGERRNLIKVGTQPFYASSGQLVYAQGGGLMAVPFNAQRLAVTGEAVPVVEGVLQSISTGSAQYSLSTTGSLVYVPGAAVQAAQRRLVWVSRTGAELPLAAPERAYRGPRLSPDGRRVAVSVEEQETQVWLYDLSRETLTRFTFAGSTNLGSIWTPDGKRITFESNKEGTMNLFWQLADGSGGLERLTTSDNLDIPGSWAPDGRLLVFAEVNPTSGYDIWTLQAGDPSPGSGLVRRAQPFLRSPFNESAPELSPDGRWLAYASDESGRNEIYVQPYPGPGGKWQISTEGGTEPTWNRNGRELFYRSGDKMMAVDISTQPSFAPGKAKALFQGHYQPTPGTLPNYDVSPDGQRFLMIKPSEQGQVAPTQINVVLNWFEELKQKVPTGKK